MQDVPSHLPLPITPAQTPTAVSATAEANNCYFSLIKFIYICMNIKRISEYMQMKLRASVIDTRCFAHARLWLFIFVSISWCTNNNNHPSQSPNAFLNKHFMLSWMQSFDYLCYVQIYICRWIHVIVIAQKQHLGCASEYISVITIRMGTLQTIQAAEQSGAFDTIETWN